MKHIKKFTAWLLLVCMLIGVLPTNMGIVKADSTLVDAAIFCSDVHGSTSDTSSVFSGIAESKLDYSTASFGGDTFTDTAGEKATVTSVAQTALDDSSLKCLYSWGDHDSSSDIEEYTGLLYGDGDNENYYVYAISKSKVTVGSKYKITVTTSKSVRSLKVNGKKYTKYKLNRKKGTKAWTITLKARKIGKFKVNVIAYNKNKLASKKITRTIKVVAKKKTTSKKSSSKSKK